MMMMMMTVSRIKETSHGREEADNDYDDDGDVVHISHHPSGQRKVKEKDCRQEEGKEQIINTCSSFC